jgi:hypothetical protein
VSPSDPEIPPAWVTWEGIGSIFWFAMDASWLWTWATGAYALIVPAAFCHLLVLWHSRAHRAELLVGLATLGWLGMNVLWMVGDLRKQPELLAAAKISFAAGVLFLALSFVVRQGAQEMLSETISRFRRMKVR